MSIVGIVTAADGEVRPRQCGRCRSMFEGDPTLHPAAMPEWWLCPQCRAVLLANSRRRRAPTTQSPPSDDWPAR